MLCKVKKLNFSGQLQMWDGFEGTCSLSICVN